MAKEPEIGKTQSSVLPEELQDLLLALRIDVNGVSHFQTLSGCLHDMLKSLDGFLHANMSRIREFCLRNSIPVSQLCGAFFESVGQYNYYKASYDFQYQIRLIKSDLGDSFDKIIFEKVVHDLCTRLYKISSGSGEEKSHGSKRKMGDRLPFGDDFEYIDRIRRIMRFYYNKIGFDRWFKLAKSDTFLHGISPITAVIGTEMFLEESAGKGPEMIYFRDQYSVLKSALEDCIWIADRKLLNCIFDHEWNAHYVIHGALISNSVSRTRMVGVLGNRKTKRTQKTKSGKTNVTCYRAYSFEERVSKVKNWIMDLPSGLRLCIVALSEEELITLAVQLRKATSTDIYDLSCIGLVKINSKGIEALDTKVHLPDWTSRSMALSPPETAAITLTTYYDFFRRYILADGKREDFNLSFNFGSLVLWGAPYRHTEDRNALIRLVGQFENSGIPVLLALEGPEKELTDDLQDKVLKKKNIIVRSGKPVKPLFSKCGFSLLEQSLLIGSEFEALILNNFRKGLNQLIIGPNPVYVQKMYHELWRLFSKSQLSSKGLIEYHSLFGLRDKTAIKRKIEVASKKETLLVVSTVNLFPDLYRYFSEIFVEGLPFYRCISIIFDRIQSRGSSAKHQVPKILWSEGSSGLDELSAQGKKEIEIELTPEKLKSWLSDSNDEDNANRYDYDEKPAPVIPYCRSRDKNNVDMLDRILLPERLIMELGGMNRRRDYQKVLLNMHDQTLIQCMLPYSNNHGIVAPPDWIDEYIP